MILPPQITYKPINIIYKRKLDDITPLDRI